MTTRVQKHCVCDRCGVEVLIDAPKNQKQQQMPDDWCSVWLRTTDAPVDMCPECVDEVMSFIENGRLVHIGHASQSGSGKRWTELGLDRQEDPEKWFKVYALYRDGRIVGADPR